MESAKTLRKCKCGENIYDNEGYHNRGVEMGFFDNNLCYGCNLKSDKIKRWQEEREKNKVWCKGYHDFVHVSDGCQGFGDKCPLELCKTRDIEVVKAHHEALDKQFEIECEKERALKKEHEKEMNEKICELQGHDWTCNPNFPGSWCERCGAERSWQHRSCGD